jgi:hypothetical protein
MLVLDEVTYIVDENLLRPGNGLVAVRNDTARFSRPPVDELLPRGITDPEWIPIVGNRGWVVITNDRRLRTRPQEAQLAITHKLKVIHLHGEVGSRPAWEQMVRGHAVGEALRISRRRHPRDHGGYRCAAIERWSCISRREPWNVHKPPAV